MRSSPLTPLFDPRDFYLPAELTHVCAAGETAFLRRHDDAIKRYIADKSAGPRGRVSLESVVEHTRGQVARMWGVGAEDIGWVSNVAEGISMVLESIDWRDGDEVCVMPSEYPSLVAPLMADPKARFKVRFSTAASSQSLTESVTPNTRAILVSYVSYLNGERYDLDLIRQAADAVGALLVVDFTQASGYMPITASIADFAFCSSYKWMLGVTGVATAYWNRARQPDWFPASAGWYSLAGDATDLRKGIELRGDAMRFTRGNPAHMSLYILSSALAYLLSFDPSDVLSHVQLLTSDLLERLKEHGIESSTPGDATRHGASVCLSRPDAKEIQIRMNDQGVLAWNGRGRLRVSFHGYNCRQDVDRVESTLLEAIRQIGSVNLTAQA